MVSNLVGHGLAVLIMGDFVHAGDAMTGNLRRSIVHTIQDPARVSRGAKPTSSSINAQEAARP
jgi:hypothetical protein